MSDPVYGSSHYWSAGKLMPPELIIPPSADPSLTVNDIQDFQYVHNQLTPSATWVVTHNLGRHPAVAVADPQGNGLTVQVDYVSLDALHLIFSTDQSGSCRCV